MPKFAANLTMLFTELPFLDRFEAAKNAGFTAIEFLFPYDYEKQQIVDLLHAHNLQLILHNLPAGNWAAGERGITTHPSRTQEFRAGVDRAIDYATTLKVPQLNCLAGIVKDNATEAHHTLVENLRYAAHRLQEAGIGLVLEPVNTRDIPGFFVNRTDQALAILDEVGSSNIKLQYDIYHAQVMEGNLAETIEKNFARIGHLQLADNPGRHEPGTGEINYNFLFSHIERLGYSGWIGCEYKPAKTTLEGLVWLQQHSVSA
jgi:hydroxypyruvate isomerase